MSALVSDVLCEFLVDCEEPADLQQIFGAMEKVSHQLGIDYFAMALLPLAHERLDSLVWQHWPDGWLNRYLQNNYFPPIQSSASSAQQHGRLSGPGRCGPAIFPGARSVLWMKPVISVCTTA